MLSGILPLIITGAESLGDFGGAETNRKLDFFSELQQGGWRGCWDPYIDEPSASIDQLKCFRVVGEDKSKMRLTLRGSEEDQTGLRLLNKSEGEDEDEE